MRQEKRTETITYIVDESYRIQYMSKALAKQFSDFEPGEICYEKFRGREKPCRNCPLAHPNRKTDLFYNELITGIDGKERYFKGIRIQMYDEIIKEIRKYGDFDIYLGMEEEYIWKKVLK